MNRNRQALLLSLLILTPLGPRQLAAQLVPSGPETRVDTPAGNLAPNCPSLGVAADGSFEISWDYGGASGKIKARHYAASGAPTDPAEVLVGSLPVYPVTRAVTPISNGFRVLMEVIDDLGGPSKFYRHRIDPSGVPAPGTPRKIGTPATDWVSAGPGDTVFAGRYDSTLRRFSVQKVNPPGAPSGPAIILNSRPIISPGLPVIAALSDGGWVAVFAGYTVSPSGAPVQQVLRARRFNAADRATGPDFDVNSIPAGPAGVSPFLGVYDPIVAAGPGGRFAVAWDISDSTGGLIRVRSFNSANVPAGPDSTIGHEDGLTGPVSIAFDKAGRFLVLWSANGDPPTFPFELSARLVRPNGSPLGPVFRPESAASGVFNSPFCGSVAWAGDSWLITWAAERGSLGPSAVFLRRFH